MVSRARKTTLSPCSTMLDITLTLEFETSMWRKCDTNRSRIAASQRQLIERC